MKLLIATPLYPPDPGGPATYSRLLEERLPHEGVEVRLVKFGAVRHLPKVVSHITYAWKVFRDGKDADVVLALDALSVGWPALFANLFLRKRFIIRVAGDHIWEQGRQRFGIRDELDSLALFSWRWNPYLSFLRMLQQITLRAAGRIIVPSEYLKKLLISWRIPEGKITVVYNAVELDTEGKVPEPVSSLPGFKVLYIGRLVPWKHVEGIIDAVASVPNGSLVVVGDGPAKDALMHRAKEKLGSCAVFTGPLSNSDSIAVLRASDALVLNSSYEGLSHVLIEGLMCGVPIVATRAGGNEEVVREGSGVLIPVGDTAALARALKGLKDNPELRARLRKGALERAREFTPERMLTRTKEVLDSI